MFNSRNNIVQTCFMNALYNSNSVIGLKIAYFRDKYPVKCREFWCSKLHQNSLHLCQVFVLLCLLKTKQFLLTIFFPVVSKKGLTLLKLLK